MLMAMNIDWKGDNTEIAVPALKPRKAEKILPAHVGQPTKRPVNAPTVDIVEIFRCGFETSTLSAYIFNVALIPTSTGDYYGQYNVYRYYQNGKFWI